VKEVISFVLALALVLSLALVVGMPVVAGSSTWYVTEGGAGNMTGEDWDNAFNSIQAGIDASGPGDTVEVASGTYEEDLVIPAGKDGLEIKGVADPEKPIIRGITVVDYYPGRHNINILSSGVKIYGFTIESPDVPEGYYSGGIHLDSTDIEIYDNDFVLTGEGEQAVAIQTWRVCNEPEADISGLKIYDNTFYGDIGMYQAIWINRDTGEGVVTVENNEFSGNVMRAIATERSNTVISGNAMTSEILSHGITVRDWDEREQENVEVAGNTVEGFLVGLVIGENEDQTLTSIVVSYNTIRGNDTGVRVRSSAGGVAVNYNNIVGNTEYGMLNEAAEELDSLYNWWGHETGPDHDLNLGGQGDGVSDNVGFGPWLYKTQEQFIPDAPCYAGSVLLANEATQVEPGSWEGGWNSFSTPITLDSSANRVSDLLDLTEGSGLSIVRAQRFDAETQSWVAIIMNNAVVGEDYRIEPGEGYFIQVSQKGSLPILVSRTTQASPPMRDLHVGWNLVGVCNLEQQGVVTALSGVDYSVVISPKPPNAEQWSITPDTADGKYLQLGEAYWVGMPGEGTLFGHTTTPVADDMTWDLNQ